MKKSKKIISIIMVVVLCFSMAISSFAYSGGVTPLLNNTADTNTVFTINENGVAIIDCSCIGYLNITTKIEIEYKLEKRFLLFFWNDVENATDYYETESVIADKIFRFQLSGTGKYRATVTYTVYGTNGEPDVIVRTLEANY